MSIDDDLNAFLHSIYPTSFFSSHPQLKPFVTLTFAQSLDGCIGGNGGSQIQLSGDESMVLTHRLRELHQSILVGVGTVITDDPSLTARIPTLLPLSSQPQPLVLDAHLRTPPNAKLMINGKKGIGHRPVIITAVEPQEEDVERRAPREALENAGADVVQCRTDLNGRVALEAALQIPEVGRSLMVEGGASIISSFLESGLVDLVIITIAPVLIGNGVRVIRSGMVPPTLEHIATKSFGKDVVLVCRPRLSLSQKGRRTAGFGKEGGDAMRCETRQGSG